MSDPTKEESFISAIEGNLSGMSHADLVLTCQMLKRGRAEWRKEAEDAHRELATVKEHCEGFHKVNKTLLTEREELRQQLADVTDLLRYAAHARLPLGDTAIEHLDFERQKLISEALEGKQPIIPFAQCSGQTPRPSQNNSPPFAPSDSSCKPCATNTAK